MRQRSNLIILFGIAFFIVGGAIAYLVLNDDDSGGGGGGGSNAVAKVSVLVATQDIEANTLGSDVLEAGILTLEEVDSGSQPVGAITNSDDLTNRIFRVPVEEGDVIVSAQVALRSLSNVQIPEGFDGVAVTIGYTNGGAGYIAPGDTVNVYGVYGVDGTRSAGLVSPDAAAGPTPRTELALTNVLVLDVSAQQGSSIQSADPDDPNATVGRQSLGTPLTYLLALTPTDAERIVQLTSFADLYLSLTADDAPNTGDTPGVGGDNVNGPTSADSAAPQS